ncbi:MAG: OmpA family protein [Chromatiales bacterium]|nr:OmpA family protein [Chromatiales bacterium]
MQLDTGTQDQKLSLDITPLIDIVFLLVMFFAVTTSFISPEQLDTLKDDLLNLGEDKKVLSGQVSQLEVEYAQLAATKQAEVRRLLDQVNGAEGREEKLKWMVDSLQKQELELKDSLAAAETNSQSLQQQLEQAYQDTRLLTIEIVGLKDESARQAAQEKLLQALLNERAAKIGEQDRNLTELNARLDQSQSEAEVRAAEIARLEKLGNEQVDTEKALRALLAERAKEAEDLSTRLASLGEAKAGLEKSAAEATQNTQRLQDIILRLEGELTKYRKVAELDKEQVDRLLRAEQQLQSGLGSYLENNQLGIKRDQQRLTLQLSDKILFDSGSDEIKPEGLKVLRSVGEVLQSRVGQLDIQIGGHTDNVPVRGKTGPLGSNWGLSAARAVNVVRFFESDVGLNPMRLSAAGYGEYRPVTDNDSSEGRAQNRRIEIVLLPR